MKHAKDDYSHHIVALVQLAILHGDTPISRQMRRGLEVSTLRDDTAITTTPALIFCSKKDTS